MLRVPSTQFPHLAPTDDARVPWRLCRSCPSKRRSWDDVAKTLHLFSEEEAAWKGKHRGFPIFIYLVAVVEGWAGSSSLVVCICIHNFGVKVFKGLT